MHTAMRHEPSERGTAHMNIHEYQAKAVLREFGVAVPRGHAAFSVDEAVKAAQDLGAPVVVVKAQIHAGGRGKAGGVKVVKSIDDVRKEADAHARLDAGDPADRPARASRSTASISRKARPSTASSISRRWSIARPRAWRSWSRPKAAWTSRRSRTSTPGEDRRPSRRSGDRHLPAPRAPHRAGAGPHRRSAEADEPAAHRSSTRPSSRRT